MKLFVYVVYTVKMCSLVHSLYLRLVSLEAGRSICEVFPLVEHIMLSLGLSRELAKI